MQKVYPDYYKEFKCINSRCRHNCCIGWEIDIDSETAQAYKNTGGLFGEKLKNNINWCQDPYFILGENERCPFLNSNNLCDIIINLGEEHLCTICSEHPRFTNQLPGRTETGLGLCCEAAAQIILGKKEPTLLKIEGEKETYDQIIALRDNVISLLQNREKNINERIDDMLKLCKSSVPQKSPNQWIDFFLDLERLDPLWTEILYFLKANYQTAGYDKFDRYMIGRETEYEQLLVYIIYRHFANAPELCNTPERAALAAMTYWLIHSIGAVIFSEKGEFTFENQVEIARMFSSEIEYSDQNLYDILEELY